VFCCVPYVQVSEVCMSGLCRPVHPVRACLGKFLARCRTGVRSPAAAENVHPWARHPVGELEDQPVKAVLARQSHRGQVRHVSGRRLADVGRSGSRQPRRGGRLLARVRGAKCMSPEPS